MRRRRFRLSPRCFNDRLPTIADNRFSILYLSRFIVSLTSRVLTRLSYNRLHDARLELKFDRTSLEQRCCFLFTDLLNDAIICIQFIRAINLYVNRLFDAIHVIYTTLLQPTLVPLLSRRFEVSILGHLKPR